MDGCEVDIKVNVQVSQGEILFDYTGLDVADDHYQVTDSTGTDTLQDYIPAGQTRTLWGATDLQVHDTDAAVLDQMVGARLGGRFNVLSAAA